MPENQDERRAAFAALLAADGTDPTNYDEGEEEDPRIYLNGDEPIGRYVVVTSNTSSRGYEVYFYLPIFETLLLATNRAVEFDRDDLFEELPVKVVDLETGTVWHAEVSYTWRKEEVGPPAVDQEGATV